MACSAIQNGRGYNISVWAGSVKYYHARQGSKIIHDAQGATLCRSRRPHFVIVCNVVDRALECLCLRCI